MGRGYALRVALSSFTVCASALPSNLRVETLANPLLLDNPSPRFSWTNAPQFVQVAYRVLVWAGDATSPTIPLQWDSGEVASNATAQVEFLGAPLASDADFRFLVSVRDASGAWANASAPGSFSTGLFKPSDWEGAAWIGGGNQLRVAVTIPAATNVTRARVYVTGVGFYELYVNGVRVTQDAWGRNTYVNPGFSTIYSTRILYNAYDVAQLLVPGAVNVVGLRLGSGKYGYLGEFCTTGPLNCSSGILRLTIGGPPSVTAVVSSGMWLATSSSIVSDHLYNGETVDGRIEKEQEGWASAGYVPDPLVWHPVTVRAFPPTATLSAHTMPQVVSWEPTRIPVSLTPVANATYVFDIGVNGAGHCRLTVHGPTPSGANVTLVHGETLAKDGSVHVGYRCPSACCADGGNCANQAFTYIMRGVAAGQSETYCECDHCVALVASGRACFSRRSQCPALPSQPRAGPTFAYSGFRYVEVLGWPTAAPAPTVNDLLCEATSSGVAVTGNVSFDPSTPAGRLLNGVQSLVVRTQRSNLYSIPTDCPQREKRGWMADASVSADEASLNFDMQLFYENWLRTHADTAHVGCGPLPKNATCPKWHPDQPVSSMANVKAQGEVASAVADEYPNCYICCAGRPGFGCVPRSPTNTTGSIADVIPFGEWRCAAVRRIASCC